MPTGDWRRSLADGIGRLGRWFQGRYILDDPESAEAIPAARYFEPDFLREAIAASHTVDRELLFADPADQVVDEPDVDIDVRTAVSRVTRHYAGCLTVTALTALAHGVALNLSPSHCRIVTRQALPFGLVLDDLGDGAMVTGERPSEWLAEARAVPTLAELRTHAWEALYGRHLAPFFEAVRRLTRVSERLLWTNAAEWVGMISDSADEYLAGDGRPYVEDRRALLGAPAVPGVPGPNPMSGLLVWDRVDDPMFPHGIHRRKACCLTYRLDDRRGRLCQNCPLLPLNERIELVRERHGLALGRVGGSAERAAIRRGLEQLSRSPAPR